MRRFTIPAIWRLRQEDQNFKACLDKLLRLYVSQEFSKSKNKKKVLGLISAVNAGHVYTSSWDQLSAPEKSKVKGIV